jgi:predicted nucleotidyltransferase
MLRGARVMSVTEVHLPAPELREFCRKWKVVRLALFGSALRDDFSPESDVDFLVSFAPDADWSLLDHICMEQELSGIVGRKAEVATRRAVERSENWIRREAILGSAQEIYAAG